MVQQILSATGEQERARQAAARRRAEELRALAAAKQRRIRAAELELGLVRRQAGGLRRGRSPDSSMPETAGHDDALFDDNDVGAGSSDCPRGACHEGDCEALSDAELEAHDALSYPPCDDGADSGACIDLAGVSESSDVWPDTHRATISASGTSASEPRWRHGGGYVPSYRERFFIEDRPECWRDDAESPADVLGGVPPGTIVAVIVIDSDGLTRGLRGVRNASAKRDARACLAFPLDGAAADAAAGAERCLRQHAIVGARFCSHWHIQMCFASSTGNQHKLRALPKSVGNYASCVEALRPARNGAQAHAAPQGTAWTAARAGGPIAAVPAAGGASGPPRQPRGRACASGATSGCWAPPRRRRHSWRPRPRTPGGRRCWSSYPSTPSTGPSRSWYRR